MINTPKSIQEIFRTLFGKFLLFAACSPLFLN